ncbi:MAG: type I polyketide synthase [Gallionellaceae bacterium]
MMVHASGNTAKKSLVSGEERTRFSVPDGRLVSLLLRAAGTPTLKGVVSILQDGSLSRQNYGELFIDASRICAGLQKEGIAPQQRVLLQINDVGDLIPAMWGCILAGAVPIPLNVALTYENSNSQIHKLINVWESFDKPLVLASAFLLDDIRGVAEFNPAFAPQLLSVDDLRLSAPSSSFHLAAPDDTAVFFLTSGSTGIPKGVPQSHSNILAMVDGTIQMNDFTENDATLNWMSLDHAGSLVFLGVMGVALKCDQFHVPISYILQNPLRWLELIHQHRISISWAPNFAFSLFLEKAEEIAHSNLDLSCMRFMVNAGEAIVSRTARAFIRMLEQHQLPFNALRPAFGMVETCSGITWSTGFTLENSSDSDTFVDLGPCIPGASMRIVDEDTNIVPEGENGRLQLMGPSVFFGYHSNDKLNSELFSDRWLSTGDLAFLRDGHLFITGREKDVIIINGNNFYCHEIEGAVEQLESITRGSVAACGVNVEGSNSEQLALFFHCKETDPSLLYELSKAIRSHVMDTVGVVPAFMIHLQAEEFPRTDIGKIQRPKLKKLFNENAFQGRLILQQKRSRRRRSGGGKPGLIVAIADIWQQVLKLDEIDYDETFFELGGHSLLAFQVQMELEILIGRPVSIVELFNTPTIRSMAEYFGTEKPSKVAAKKKTPRNDSTENDSGAIAVIGMACRLPGADGPEQFWDNLKNGIESITFYTPEDAIKAGLSPQAAYNPAHVHAAPILDDIEGFDADFWKYSAREARLIDPQQRIFLETAWEAFEDAGYTPSSTENVGVFASAGTNTYLLNNILSNADWIKRENLGRLLTVDSMNGFNVMITNDKDYLPMRVSYKLDLTGPSINIQTACSSTLVAIHEACKSLRTGESEMALAGGCAAMVPQLAGHLYSEGMLGTPDGHCRAYDEAAQGTIFGSGSGAVLLKRLDSALADKDQIYAVIRGSAIRNDGGQKMGFAAPSMMGEYGAARGALENADISADTIGFMEGHGTGTPLGDPIEVEALSKAFRHDSERNQYCALGSVKTNIGHMGIASGIAGAMKTILTVQHGQIPPTLHFETPNSRIDFNNSPFFVNNRLQEWPSADKPRRAGVNSLGIGGRNAHVIFEQAPARSETAEQTDSIEILPLSAKTPAALKALTEKYSKWLTQHPNESLRNICFTAQLGREHFAHRRSFVASGHEQLLNALTAVSDISLETSPLPTSKGVTFLFTGQGAQYIGMAQRLYQCESVFREELDECVELFAPLLEKDLLKIMFDEEDDDNQLLNQTAYAQPAIFAIQVALLRLLEHHGVNPSCLIAHSIGEFASAWCAGVISIEDAVKLVAARGRLMQALPSGGAMTAVLTRRETMQKVLSEAGVEISMAAWNSPVNQVISGPSEKIEAAVAALRAADITVKNLQVSHAFHSELMDAMLQDFRTLVEGVTLARPSIPFISTLTGQLADEELTTPDYWVRHAREAVQYEPAIKLALDMGYRTFIELGPHPTLCALGQQTSGDIQASWQCCLHRKEDDELSFQTALAGLYQAGANLDWATMNEPKPGQRLSLPTYPWQRTRHWIDADTEEVLLSKTKDTQANDPLLGERIALPRTRQQLYRSLFNLQSMPMLQDHRVFGHVVPPGAMYASQLLRSAINTRKREALAINNLMFLKPMVVKEDGGRDVQVILTEVDGSLEGEIVSCVAGESSIDSQFIVHASARIVDSGISKPQFVDLIALQAACTEAGDVAAHQDNMQKMKIDLGPSFRWLTSIHKGKHQALASLAPPEDLGDIDAIQLHPGLIDAHWQVLVEAMPIMQGETVIPFCIDSLQCHSLPSNGRLWCHAEWDADAQQDGRFRGNIKLISDEGRILLETNGLELRRADEKNIRSALEEDISDWLYGFEWKSVNFPSSQNLIADSYLIVGPSSSTAPFADLLNNRGASVVLEDSKGDLEQVKSRTTIALDSAKKPIKTVIFIAGDALVTNAAAECHRFLGLTQALIQHNTDDLRLILLTHDTQDVAQSRSQSINVAHAALWGMAASLMHEQPEIAVLRIDLETHELALPAAADLIMGNDNSQPQLAWRQGQFYAPLLTKLASTGVAEVQFSPGTVQLITGGSGGLGLTVAKWLVDCGARKLVLAGRSEPTPQALETLNAMQKQGVEINIVACDITQPDDVQHLVDMAVEHGHIQSVFHLAGIRDDGFMRNLDEATFDRVLLAKLDGAWNLHRALKGHEPEFMVFFSSVASVFGSAGQSNYAAGNATLDALASYRRQEGHAALSINWGPWSDVGMAAGMDERHKERLNDQGYLTIPRESGLKALAVSLSNNHLPRLMVAPLDRKRISSLTNAASLLQNFIETKPVDLGQSKLPPLVSVLNTMPPEQIKIHIEKHLLELVTDLLQGDLVQQLDVNVGLFDLGMDSLTSVEIKDRLERDLGCKLRSTLAFDYPTIGRMAKYLTETLFADSVPEQPTSVVDTLDLDGFSDAELAAILEKELNS